MDNLESVICQNLKGHGVSDRLADIELSIAQLHASLVIIMQILSVTPAQLAFNHDMILPTSFATNWYAINTRKQINCNLPLMPKTANAFCMNSASMTTF
jgi:hypothetical protein